MNHPQRPPLRIDAVTDLVAIVPNVIGFTPENSLVVLGLTYPQGRIKFVFRYDLPGIPTADIAAHAAAFLARHRIPETVVIGYGPGTLVTPAVEAMRHAISGVGVGLRDVLRVHEGRYWSYICTDLACCPPEGVPFDPSASPAAQKMDAAGLTALPSRASLAETIAPLTGPDADAMTRATAYAEHRAGRLLVRDGPRGLVREGRTAVQAAIAIYRDGSQISMRNHAWLALVVTSCLPVRDDAWARMDPAHVQAHRQLWTDLTHHAQPGYVAAPASLLAFTAWQCGDGALANVALDRAEADDPDYTMAALLRQAVNAGLPPSAAVLPMTPAEVAASYTDPSDD